MRRAINWFVVLLSLVALFVGISLPGCGSSGGSSGADPQDPVDPPASTGMLRLVRDAAELESTLKDALGKIVAAGATDTPAAAPGAAGGASNFSGTYTAEAGVDELDTARYDGHYLYVATRIGGTASSREIRILRTDPATATANQVGSIALGMGGELQGELLGMYVANDRLLLVTSEMYYGTWGGAWPAVMVWAPNRFSVQVYDVRDPAHPQRLMSATADGVFVASRRIDDRVVLVSRHAPHALVDPQAGRRVASLTLGELLPSITVDGHKDSLVDPRRCYVTNGDDHGYPVLTTITTMSLSNPHDMQGTCYDQEANGVYASRGALYVSEPRYQPVSGHRTRIHKFSLEGVRAEYAGSAEVSGALWNGGQRDFRMSESGDQLRVMLTEITNDPADYFDHRLYVLRPKANERALEIIGKLPSDAHPEEIGKPNEDLYGVRFDSDRAFAVTFQRIDPLYVIDLSNPEDPHIAGHLTLPGVSEFLHPVSRDLLLGLGMESRRVKLELYDTSVLESPQSRGAVSIGTQSSSSTALYDRHAFTYLAGDDSDRLAISAVLDMQGELHQFEIQGKDAPASASLVDMGVVAPLDPMDSTAYQPVPDRAFIDGDTVYYVRDGKVWGSSWAAPSQVNGPY
jgi:hypothetical protein